MKKERKKKERKKERKNNMWKGRELKKKERKKERKKANKIEIYMKKNCFMCMRQRI